MSTYVEAPPKSEGAVLLGPLDIPLVFAAAPKVNEDPGFRALFPEILKEEVEELILAGWFVLPEAGCPAGVEVVLGLDPNWNDPLTGPVVELTRDAPFPVLPAPKVVDG